MGRASKLLAIAVSALIGLVLVPMVFVTSLLGASFASCSEASAATGGADDPIDLSAFEIAAKVYRAGLDTGHGEREILTAFTVVLVEGGGGVTMANPPGGTGSSLGAFQQQDFAPWNQRNRMNVYEASLSFFEVLDDLDHGQSIGELAADAQRPAESLRFKYALALPRARYFYERVSADSPAVPTSGGGLASITAPGSSCGGPLGPPGRGQIGAHNDVAPPANAPARVRRVIEAANQINQLPYVWGGGHLGWQDSRGYDCSGAVGFALHAGGFQSSPMVASQYGSWGSPGPGSWITVYSNSGHVFMFVAGVRFDTSSYEPVSSGSGPRWRNGSRPTAGFVATHPEGY